MSRSHSSTQKTLLTLAGAVCIGSTLGAVAGAESASAADRLVEPSDRVVSQRAANDGAKSGDPATREIAARYLRAFNDTDPKKVDPNCVPDMLVFWPGKQREAVKLQQTSSMNQSGQGANPLGATYDQAAQEKSVVIAQGFRGKRPTYPVGIATTGVRASDGAFVLRVKNFSAAPTDFVDVLPGEAKTLVLGSPDDPELTWTVSHSITRFVPTPRSTTVDALTDIKIAVYEAPNP